MLNLLGFSTKVYNIRQLLKNNCRFLWSDICESEFNSIKEAIIHAPILSPFNMNHTSIITVDASNKGLGGVLSQIDTSGKESIVAYASRALSPSECKFSVIEKETLAVVWALEHFRTFIWGNECVVRSDHKP